MPYQRLLDDLVRHTGAEGALLLDSEGEVVVEAGARDERHRLIGAYQGIGLAALQRSANRSSAGALHYVLCRYAGAAIILRPLKDGYYLVLSVAPGPAVAVGVHRSALVQERMNAEL
jgi:predicted regulator of Ras-like GTPase activity (Roadblock/LC7/MglB family)